MILKPFFLAAAFMTVLFMPYIHYGHYGSRIRSLRQFRTCMISDKIWNRLARDSSLSSFCLLRYFFGLRARICFSWINYYLSSVGYVIVRCFLEQIESGAWSSDMKCAIRDTRIYTVSTQLATPRNVSSSEDGLRTWEDRLSWNACRVRAVHGYDERSEIRRHADCGYNNSSAICDI